MKDITEEELNEAKIQAIGNTKIKQEGSAETALNSNNRRSKRKCK
jgi:hypothetical protein